MESLKEYSDELCRPYELYLAVKHCQWCSFNKEDFIENIKKLGYKVESTDERKYITFATPDDKKCRNRKLYPLEHFAKEALLKAFELNK